MPRGFNLSQFKSTVNHNDILRTNKSLMEFSMPRGLQSPHPDGAGNMESLRYLEYWCEVSQQPGINFLTTDARKFTYGPMQKRPYVTTFNDLAFTFYDDGKGDNWRFFDNWFRLVNNSTLSKEEISISDGEKTNGIAEPVYPYEMSYRDDYITDTHLYIYDNEGVDPVKTIKFREMYPLSIADSPLSWADNNSLLRFTVNMHFLEWWEVDPKIARHYGDERVYYKSKTRKTLGNNGLDSLFNSGSGSFT